MTHRGDPDPTAVRILEAALAERGRTFGRE